MVRSRNIKTAALLQRIGEPDASRVSELIDGLKRADILERDAWCDLIKDVGAPAVPGLVELLAHPDANIRWHGVDTLCEIDGNPELISAALASCLSDSEASIRVTSALGLSKHNAAAEHAVPILIQCLHDSDDDCYDDECTKIEAAYALGEFSPPGDETISELIAALDDSVACIAAADSLAKHGPVAAAATPRLRELMSNVATANPGGRAPSQYEIDGVSIAVARALFRIANECHEEVLVRIIQDPATQLLHRPNAIELLGAMPFGEGAARVLKHLVATSEDPHLRRVAEAALNGRQQRSIEAP